ncbi:flavin reductase family protein [Flavilitoribacter nigricans]|uniref:Flavin reductase n=1 Tax=Flavilitoribacter nigricans (strain ATCC 23147 / DSM 23189 / NBRC 102662 / NCIMB 1420 / SS-2) TaxID=1122177 RepID=A0A2D0NK42_FLAN2|nr:flavin reductase family protein [Flavilitoribacter nigricans]PHN08579.1 flavin reductase [Flavilitoribacter nigricans DSM 23189 = NBRC 102662]
MISIDPKTYNQVALSRLLTGAVAPRPIALVSSISQSGAVNLSPYSFFNVFSYRPPILIFSVSRRMRDNTTKDTLENVLEKPEVVINIVNHDLVEQMSLTSTEYDRGVNEYEKAGLTPIPSERVQPPRVAESPVAFECKVNQVLPLGETGGAGNLVVCEVILAHYSEQILIDEGTVDPVKLDAVARMGNNWYSRANGDSLFEIVKPGQSLGIGVDKLPDPIRYSSVLSGNDLGRLGNLKAFPDAGELETIKKEEVVRALIETKAPEEQWHTLAKRVLEVGEREKALAILMIGLESYAIKE